MILCKNTILGTSFNNYYYLLPLNLQTHIGEKWQLHSAMAADLHEQLLILVSAEIARAI